MPCDDADLPSACEFACAWKRCCRVSRWGAGAAFAFICIVPFFPRIATAQEQNQERPQYELIRYEEDWGSLRDASRRTHFLDSLKYIPLGRRNDWYVTLGGETRHRYEYFNNPTWGLDPQDNNGYLLQRYMIHADLHLGERFRVFGQLKSNVENGRTGGPRPPDEDRLDVHQAFIETQPWAAGDGQRLSVRAGRQEISLGSSRLVGIREGPNVRQSFDGGRLKLEHSGWKIEALALRPVETNRGVFDDSPGHERSLWGVYANGSLPILPGNADLYYLGLDRKSHEFDQGTAREQRHSLGLRLFGNPEQWDYDYEAVWQFGAFGPSRIRAWTVASNTGYTWREFPLQPRVGLKADVASGDEEPFDQSLGTFNALFPKGAYFSEADLLGPYNLIDLHPSLTLNITETVTFTLDADFFWRHSTRDGIYDNPGNLLVSGKTSNARYTGAHTNIAVEWQATPQLKFEAHYLHFFPGRFLKEAGLNRPVNFVGVWVKYMF